MVVTSCWSCSKRSRSKGSCVNARPFWAMAWTLRAHCRMLTAASIVLQVADQRIAKRTRGHFLRAFHHTREVVSHGLLADRTIHGSDDGIGSFEPAHVAQHHLA